MYINSRRKTNKLIFAKDLPPHTTFLLRLLLMYNTEGGIMLYSVIYSDNISDLIARVNTYCKSGYEPQGGVETMSFKDGTFGYLQAVVKDEED